MNQAIAIIQADMRQNARAGHSYHTYGAYHVIAALEEAGIDPDSLDCSFGELILGALTLTCLEALNQ